MLSLNDLCHKLALSGLRRAEFINHLSFFKLKLLSGKVTVFGFCLLFGDALQIHRLVHSKHGLLGGAVESILSFSIDAHFRDHSLLVHGNLITYLLDLHTKGTLLLFLTITTELC